MHAKCHRACRTRAVAASSPPAIHALGIGGGGGIIIGIIIIIACGGACCAGTAPNVHAAASPPHDEGA
jgi:hypothetical protein